MAAAFQDRRLRRLAAAGVLALSLSIMGYLVYRNWQQLAPYREQLQERYPLVLLAFLLCPAGLVPNAAGWHLLMARLGGLDSFRVNARIYCYSCLPKYVPGSVWHIAGRAYLNQERDVPQRVTLLASSLEWLLLVVTGLIVYLLFGLIGKSSGHGGRGLSPPLALALLLPLLLIVAPPVFNRLAGWLMTRLKRPPPPPMRTRDLAMLVGLYGLAWIAGGIVLYVLSRAIVPLPIAAIPGTIAAWGGAGALGLIAVYFLQGLGIRDVTLAVLLGGLMPLPAAVVASILFRLLLTLGDVAWPLLWAWLLRDRRRIDAAAGR